jgi:hypothetical protein
MARGRFKLLAVCVAPEAVPILTANEVNLCKMRISELRGAIRKNQVSFPSQVPMFPKHDRPDLQRKLAQLYFVLGWSAERIGARYGLGRSRAQQILNTWRRRAVEAGYVQAVPPVETLVRSKHVPVGIVLSQVLDNARGFSRMRDKCL